MRDFKDDIEDIRIAINSIESKIDNIEIKHRPNYGASLTIIIILLIAITYKLYSH